MTELLSRLSKTCLETIPIAKVDLIVDPNSDPSIDGRRVIGVLHDNPDLASVMAATARASVHPPPYRWQWHYDAESSAFTGFA